MLDGDVDVIEVRPTSDEIRMGVASVEILHWGRTTLVRLCGADGFETVGAYTAGPRNNVVEARMALARANAMRRLCAWKSRREVVA